MYLAIAHVIDLRHVKDP